MKQRDLFAIGILAIIVAVAAWILTNQFIVTPENKTAEVEIVEPYQTDFNQDSVKLLSNPARLDFTRDPNLDAGGSDHTLTNQPEL
jgi:hypothetical protein